MKLYIKQKVFSIGERFTVKDEFGNDRYFVEGEWLSIPKKFRILDEITIEIVKEFSFFRPKYRIDGSPFSVEGDVFTHDYTILRDGTPVASISKEWFTWGDSYMIDNYKGEDEEMLLAILIVIDFVLSRD